MPHNRIEPTVPSDQDVVQAEEVGRALERSQAGDNALRVQIAAAGREVLDLPPIVARLLMDVLKVDGCLATP